MLWEWKNLIYGWFILDFFGMKIAKQNLYIIKFISRPFNHHKKGFWKHLGSGYYGGV